MNEGVKWGDIEREVVQTTVPTECLGICKFENMILILKGGPQRLERGGPALLTVETEANEGLRSTNESGSSSVDSLCSLYWYKRFMSCLVAVVGPFS